MRCHADGGRELTHTARPEGHPEIEAQAGCERSYYIRVFIPSSSVTWGTDHIHTIRYDTNLFPSFRATSKPTNLPAGREIGRLHLRWYHGNSVCGEEMKMKSSGTGCPHMAPTGRRVWIGHID